MPGRAGRRPELTPFGAINKNDVELIDMVVQFVVETDEIPNMESMGVALGITRQGVLRRMSSAAKRGIMPKRPRYATRWFELTPLGEELYAAHRKDKAS